MTQVLNYRDDPKCPDNQRHENMIGISKGGWEGHPQVIHVGS